MRCSFNTS